jgi:hypothetical protein
MEDLFGGGSFGGFGGGGFSGFQQSHGFGGELSILTIGHEHGHYDDY